VGLPMLMLSRHSLDRRGEPVEWVRAVYRGDRYKFVANLQRPGPHGKAGAEGDAEGDARAGAEAGAAT
jgi:GntR family transcriptional regulator